MEQTFIEGYSYIIKKRFVSSISSKVKVIDVTKTSLLIKWENTETPQRYLIDDFISNYRIIEVLENNVISLNV